MPHRGRTACALFVAASFATGEARLAAQESAPPPEVTAAPEETAEEASELEVSFGIEAKVHYRDSEEFRIANPFHQ